MNDIQNLESDLSAASEFGLAFWPVFLFPSTSPPFFIIFFFFLNDPCSEKCCNAISTALMGNLGVE